MSKHDLITKDYALYIVHYYASMLTWSKKDILAEIDKKIKESDPIDPESLRPQGVWKKGRKEKLYCDWEMNGWYDYPEICTNCGYDATEYGAGVGNYCPNCGARMEKDGDT